jgi:hypothetical protein
VSVRIAADFVVVLSQTNVITVTNATVQTVTKKEVGHLCYMSPLIKVLPTSDGILYVFYDFETTQNSRYSEKATKNVINLVCL